MSLLSVPHVGHRPLEANSLLGDVEARRREVLSELIGVTGREISKVFIRGLVLSDYRYLDTEYQLPEFVGNSGKVWPCVSERYIARRAASASCAALKGLSNRLTLSSIRPRRSISSSV